jgi:uncharacterized tellurite resistance protein B-like protein
MVSNTTRSNQQLLKILIAVAWLDGQVQTEEQRYLRWVAEEQGLKEDPEIHKLLEEMPRVEQAQADRWINDYLGDKPSEEDCHKLIEDLSGLIYSDGNVATEEARLLTRLQNRNGQTIQGKVSLNAKNLARKLYQRWILMVEGGGPDR